MKPVLLFLAAAHVLSAQPHSTYDIRRASAPIVIDGRLDEKAWSEAPPAGGFHFTWWKQGEKEQTVARLLWDDENLYVGYFCHDKHISAYVTQRHGAVSKDDCVEIFLSPNPDKVTNYYTFEINAIGTMLNRCRTDWWSGPPTWEPEDVRHRTSFHGLPKKDESPGDDHWAVEMAIPFKNFARDAEHTPPRAGDRWRLNLNRTGGLTNRQSSSWSPIATPAPAFHTPSAFGWVRFVGAAAATPQRRNPQSAAEGRALYNRNCTMCHGLDGEAGDRAPALAATRRYLRTSEGDLFDAIRHGISGTMMPPTALPDGDVWKIVAYIRGLRATAFEEEVAGNVAAGEKVFAARCSNCHTINGRGGLLGPDLSDIGGTRRLAVLRETLTKPLPYVPRGYQPVTVVATDGRSIRGLAKNENNFSLQVLDMDGKLHLFQRDELREISHDKQSLMPRNFDKVLRPEEFQDLLAFLSRQARSKMQ